MFCNVVDVLLRVRMLWCTCSDIQEVCRMVATLVLKYFYYTTSVTLWLSQCGMRQKKNHINIRNIYLKCVCGAACAANRISSANGKTSANHKVSSEGFFIHIIFQNAVQLCLRSSRSGAAFVRVIFKDVYRKS